MSQPTIRSIPKPGKRVNCETHGHVPGYVVCSCVSKFSSLPKHVRPPMDGALGEILCERVANHEQWEYVLVCMHCAKERGFLDKAKKRFGGL